MMDADKYCSGCAKDAAECICGEPSSVASSGSPLMSDMITALRTAVKLAPRQDDHLMTKESIFEVLREVQPLLRRYDSGER